MISGKRRMKLRLAIFMIVCRFVLLCKSNKICFFVQEIMNIFSRLYIVDNQMSINACRSENVLAYGSIVVNEWSLFCLILII